MSHSALAPQRLHRHRTIAALCLFAQFLGVAHLLLVRHETCYEHQELVHATGHHDDAPPFARGPAADEQTSVRASTPEGTGQEEDHCLLAGLRKRELLPFEPPAAALPAPPPAEDVARLTAPRTQAAPVVALLHLAPKGSPPIAI